MSFNNGFGSDVPPDKGQVMIYFLQKGYPESDALKFYVHYNNRLWRNAGGDLISDWKCLAWQWIWNR
jgi:hypothetical protein